jgi:hypothetical protein
LQRRLFGAWYDNIKAKHAIGWDFQGNSVTGGWIRNPLGVNPFWFPHSINWTQSNTNGILLSAEVHTSNWNWPSDNNGNTNLFIGPNPAHSAGNVHRVNASRVQALVESTRMQRSAGVTLNHN